MGNQHGKTRKYYGRKIDWENAERPSPPGKPYLFSEDPEQQSDVIIIRWSPPQTDGGAPIIGYLVEHKRTGSPHWLRAIPHLTPDPELVLTGLEPGWRYQFRVSAENDIGRSDPGELSEPLTVTLQRSAASAPHFNTELQDTIALENEKVEFVVNVLGTPPPKICWYKDGFEIFSSRRTKIVTETERSTLIIHQAALEDEGEIKCTATNRAGHVVTKAVLKLEAPPRIRLPRQYEEGLLFEIGELIRLKVSLAGRPLPTVAWYHDGELLHSGERYEITSTERNSTLRIDEARRGDRGEYQIKALNKIGEDVASCLVTVTDRPMPPGKAKVLITLGRSVTLSWTAPEDDGGCKIGTYIVEYFRIGWNMWLKAATSRQLTTVLGNLIEGSEYKFRVKAENPYGVSDPSEESDIIFIPDPKRGLLEAPLRKDTDLSDPWLEDIKKRHLEEERDEIQEAKRKKGLEERIERLLEGHVPIYVSEEKSTEEKENLTVSGNDVSKSETGKRSFETLDTENIAPPIPKRRGKLRGSVTPEPETVESESPTKDILVENVDLQPKVPEKSEQEVNEDREDTSLSNSLKMTRKDWNLETSLTVPRDNDDSVLHGSSELMLVLLPQAQELKSAELTAQHKSEIEASLLNPEAGVAPPLSLSAPELGTGEPLEIPPMREAVSSTELLHERAMARFYQDAADEELQGLVKRRYSGDRKSLERRSSVKEAGGLERRHSMKEGEAKELSITFPLEDRASEPRSTKIKFDENETLKSEAPQKEKSPVNKVSKIPKPEKHESDKEVNKRHEVTFEDKITNEAPNIRKKPRTPDRKPKSILHKKEERLSSVEREQLEFALVRDRLREKNEQNFKPKPLPPRPPNLQQQSSMSSQMSSFEGDDSRVLQDEDYDGELEEEYAEEEEGEYDYLENEAAIKEESVPEEEEGIETLNDAKYRPKTIISKQQPFVEKYVKKPSPPISRKKKKAPFAEEEDTYHPRSMIPTRSVIPKLEISLPTTVEITDENESENKEKEEKVIAEEMNQEEKTEEPQIPKKEEVTQNKVDHPEEMVQEVKDVKLDQIPPEKEPDKEKEKKDEQTEEQKVTQVEEQKTESISESTKEQTSKIPIPAQKTKKQSRLMKKIEKLSLKKDKKPSAVTELIVESTTPVASVVLPKPILKKKDLTKKKGKDSKEKDDEKETEENVELEQKKEETKKDEDVPWYKRKKQVRISEPGSEAANTAEPKLSPKSLARQKRLQQKQLSLEEDEQATKVLIYHYSDILREYGGGKKSQPKLYLDYEELKAHVNPEEEKDTEIFETLIKNDEEHNEEEKEVNGKEEEKEGSIPDVAETNEEEEEPEVEPENEAEAEKEPEPEIFKEVETTSPREGSEIAEVSPEPEESGSVRSSPDRSGSQSPSLMNKSDPVGFLVDYIIDLTLFMVACWLYIFKNERYAIPVLCLMVYRQIQEVVIRKYKNVKESIVNKIPERFKKKSETENSEEKDEQED